MGPNSQHHSNQHHSMHQMAQTHKKLKKQQQGGYGYMPGAKGGDKSRKGSKNVMAVSKNNYGQHDDMNGKMKGISNKLEDYYSTSSDSEHDDESSDDEQHGHLESSSDESSIVSDILKEGANIPALNDMEGPINNLNIDVSNKKKKKKKRKKKKKKKKYSALRKSKKKKKKKENSVSKSKSKRKKKVKKKKKKRKKPKSEDSWNNEN